MPGGNLQLSILGEQDMFLTGNPQITYFKTVYRRHTNFSIETKIVNPPNNTLENDEDVIVIPKQGDLIYKMSIFIHISKGTKILQETENQIVNIGTKWLNKIDFKIGEKIIESLSREWIETYNMLTQENERGIIDIDIDDGVSKYKQTLFQRLSNSCGKITHIQPDDILQKHYKSIIPLNFWFCKNSGLSIPICCLKNQNVELIIDHNLSNLFENSKKINYSLFIDYIHLDVDECKRFKKLSHDYLIEQVQQIKLQSIKKKDNNFKDVYCYDFELYNPVKQLIWISGDQKKLKSEENNIPEISFELDDKQWIQKKSIEHYSKKQIYDNYIGPGGLNHVDLLKKFKEFNTLEEVLISALHIYEFSYFDDSICVYSFALNPEKNNPSGSCNFSRINKSTIKYHLNKLNNDESIDPPDLILFAINYNILQVKNGSGHLIYSK
jgi:hypothetical protein